MKLSLFKFANIDPGRRRGTACYRTIRKNSALERGWSRVLAQWFDDASGTRAQACATPPFLSSEILAAIESVSSDCRDYHHKRE